MSVQKKGFTLIELLIVISIISILMAIGIATYGKFLKDGRDTRRQSDLKQIQSALERYRADHGSYPSVLTDLSGSMPTDPVSGNYVYTPLPSLCTTDCYRYTLRAESAENGIIEVSSPD